MNALRVLKQDHQKVKTLFGQVEELGDRANAQRKKLFQQIDKELSAHAEIEERIFYPEFRRRANGGEEKDEVLEAYEEHSLVKTVIGQLEDLDPKDETYKPKLQVLKELVDHHVKEEERTMFKMAREMFDNEELDELGNRLLQAKEQLQTSRR
ncbi:MAG TPA: hemerythrin domain-containing protein [Candidatus Baltobacteraceae bacterium]|nr:hemerythrin domain-containing protein [Candidatus Baltobacteraceae bacterium]